MASVSSVFIRLSPIRLSSTKYTDDRRMGDRRMRSDTTSSDSIKLRLRRLTIPASLRETAPGIACFNSNGGEPQCNTAMSEIYAAFGCRKL